jgi:hypothetical protein
MKISTQEVGNPEEILQLLKLRVFRVCKGGHRVRKLSTNSSVKEKDLPSKRKSKISLLLDKSEVGYYGCLFQGYHETRNLQGSLPSWS